MNTRRCLKIAERLHALLLVEIGQGIDSLRMIAEPLYARDVLLVCDAMPGTELAMLAGHFRVAANERPADEGGASPTAPARSSGRRSGSAGSAAADGRARPSTGFGPSSQSAGQRAGSPPDSGSAAAVATASSRWFSPSRWLSGKQLPQR